MGYRSPEHVPASDAPGEAGATNARASVKVEPAFYRRGRELTHGEMDDLTVLPKLQIDPVLCEFCRTKTTPRSIAVEFSRSFIQDLAGQGRFCCETA